MVACSVSAAEAAPQSHGPTSATVAASRVMRITSPEIYALVPLARAYPATGTVATRACAGGRFVAQLLLCTPAKCLQPFGKRGGHEDDAFPQSGVGAGSIGRLSA